MERYLKKLSLVVCMVVALAAMFGLQTKAAWASPNDSRHLVELPNMEPCDFIKHNYTLEPTCYPDTSYCQPGGTKQAEVLLVEDVLPWGYWTDGCVTPCNPVNPPPPPCPCKYKKGAVEQALESIAGKSYCRITSGKFKDMTPAQIGAYRIVFIPSDQNTQFYINVDMAMSALTQALYDSSENDPLVAIIHMATGPNDGVIDSRRVLPLGGYDNFGFAPSGPLQGGGNRIKIITPDDCILNGLYESGLRYWQYSDHGYFTNPPQNATIITADEDYMGTNPRNAVTMMQYMVGDYGHVITTTQTVEYAYATNLDGARKLLVNEITCAQKKLVGLDCCRDIVVPAVALLESKMDQMEITIGSILNYVKKLDTVITTLNEIKNTTYTCDVGALTTQMNTIKTQITDVKKDTSDIRSTDVAAIKTQITSVCTKVDQVEAKLDKPSNTPNMPWKKLLPFPRRNEED